MTVVAPDYKDPDTTKEYEATVVGSDTYSDLAVLKISRDDPFEYADVSVCELPAVEKLFCTCSFSLFMLFISLRSNPSVISIVLSRP